MDRYELKIEDLFGSYDEKLLAFENTDELTPLQGSIGQDRASAALSFGLKMKQKGYNIFVAGEWGTGRKSYVKLVTDTYSAKQQVPVDWVYVNNFKNYYNPIALSFKPGNARLFAKALDRAISLIEKQIGEVFLSKEYENSRLILVKEFNRINRHILEELNLLGKKYGFQFSQNDQGLVSIPIKQDGQLMSEDEYRNLTNDEFEKLKTNSHNMSLEAVEYFNKLKTEEDRLMQRIRNLDEQTARRVVEFHILSIKKKVEINEKTESYLQFLIEDLVENVDYFKEELAQEPQNPLAALTTPPEENFLDRYKVNVLIDNSKRESAPVIFESNPNVISLMGIIEYKTELGVLKTDFMQIKPGSLHQANGGYLIVQAKDVLVSLNTWKTFKRALTMQQIQIDTMMAQTNFLVTSSLKPQPIPLDIKVIMIGDYETYSLLYEYDEEFRKLFKVMADFDELMDRSDENIHKLTRFIAGHCEKEGLRPFSRSAVSSIIEYSSRMAEDKFKLSSNLNKLVELLYESDSWAENDDEDIVEGRHVKQALEQIERRHNKIEEQILELFSSGDYLIDTEGFKLGEINGLAVLGTGQYNFGKPSKITVSAYKGKAGIINIEREARTSGRIHDKGVMILTGYMGYKYAQDKPLALSASIVFEQLYSGVEGDSASSTELYALLSALAGVPINQGIAVTGSVNQRGQVQPIGGVNEKIEGFFKVCTLKGITGKQGVMIPRQNVRNLMLSETVRKAVEEGMFHIYAVSTIDEGIEILTGLKAGDVSTENTIHYLVNEKLRSLGSSVKEG